MSRRSRIDSFSWLSRFSRSFRSSIKLAFRPSLIAIAVPFVRIVKTKYGSHDGGLMAGGLLGKL